MSLVDQNRPETHLERLQTMQSDVYHVAKPCLRVPHRCRALFALFYSPIDVICGQREPPLNDACSALWWSADVQTVVSQGYDEIFYAIFWDGRPNEYSIPPQYQLQRMQWRGTR